jgi:hypothetical protein
MYRLVAAVCTLMLPLMGCGTDVSENQPPSPPAPGTPTKSTSAFPHQPLWPFESQQEADRWRSDPIARAEDRWHGEAAATALEFTQSFLGFAEIDRIIHVDDQGSEALVSVGYTNPNGKDATAATIHLVRFGTAPDAPWEVVGTRDALLTLDTPAYGSAVAGSVIDAGGTITGVDECVHLEVRQRPLQRLLGEFSCLMTGGEARRWSAEVTMTGAQPGAITLVAWTGGHSVRIERFAVTGLRVE